MLQIKTVSRKIIDGWKVADSGLPIRVVNSTASANIHKISDLRKWNDARLLELRGMGRISLGHIHDFFRITGQLEHGKLDFQNVMEMLPLFLDHDELKVVTSRYGLALETPDVFRHSATLQDIGTAEHKTRERIRQIQETALHKLRSNLARCCLDPVTHYFSAFLDRMGHVASCEDVFALHQEPVMAGRNPCGLLMLLSELRPQEISCHNRFFSTLPCSTLEKVERFCLAFLEGKNQPVSQDDLSTSAKSVSDFRTLDSLPRIISVLLDHCPEVAATVDNRYFLYTRGGQKFLLEIMNEQVKRPVHYRAVTHALNERLKPRSRKGSGFVLDLLNTNAQCTRVDRGIYDFKAV